MAITYKSQPIVRPGQSIFLATPAKERIKPGYAYSLAMTTAELARQGIPFQLAIMEDNCHVDDGRNALAKDFYYDTQCSDLVFLDADLRWTPEMLMQLISHEVEDIIGGAYPVKNYPIRFPVGKLLQNEGDKLTRKGVLSMSYIPTGFMRIPRTAFEKMAPTQTSRGRIKPQLRFFERRYTTNTYDGGDVTFCRKWIAAGGKVLCDSKIRLEHIGEWRWNGCFLEHLNNPTNKEKHTLKAEEPIPIYEPKEEETTNLDDCVQALHDDQAAHSDFVFMADQWGNKPWAATDDFCEAGWNIAMSLPEGSKILECGAGLSSIVFGIAAKLKKFSHVVLEHEDGWVKPGSMLDAWCSKFDISPLITIAPIDKETKWYGYEPKEPPDLIIIDGPPRWMGVDRLFPLRQPSMKGKLALLDDVDDEVVKELKAIGGMIEVFEVGGRHAAVFKIGINDTPQEVKPNEQLQPTV